jgi:hypothetical protein
MKLKLAGIFLASALFAALPAAAGHRHGRDCGHYYSRSTGKWIAVSLLGRQGGFSFGYRSASPYYYDKHSYKRAERYCKHSYRGRGRGRGHHGHSHYYSGRRSRH